MGSSNLLTLPSGLLPPGFAVVLRSCSRSSRDPPGWADTDPEPRGPGGLCQLNKLPTGDVGPSAFLGRRNDTPMPTPGPEVAFQAARLFKTLPFLPFVPSPVATDSPFLYPQTFAYTDYPARAYQHF